ncbi:chemotaxis protein CheB [Desulfonatronum sp. SC1]|uniref:chemotaxis protein CheB n=1 Tax=Desulfonatronum sp. SC1 TaxID=2109626 RepID=UPI000D301094|nr:chemotaxis protein CheB [Desulfonatronum sp. SC1]PTN36341.1 chemotaxis protein CheR [Desulfonatronum sp. SC1]
MAKQEANKKEAAQATAQGTVDTPPGAGEASADVLAATAPGGFPIVGIGASAGGLAAFEAFFSGMPAIGDPGMAFVLVQHLAPDHKSILTDLIRRYTRMQVFEVEDGMTVHPNCAYIIPPGRDMAFLNGALQLLEPSAPRGQRLPIDFFFRSLAQDQRERCIGIVLSGTGSDGTLGVRAIKGEGGMVMAQNPASTEYDGMPRSAVATGLVDFVLPPAEMPAQLIAYTVHAFGHPPKPTTPTSRVENAMNKIFVLLRSQVGHDFSQYKPSSVQRRIERRMAVQQIESMDDYVKFIRATPTETEALFRDMLIGVTSFFRDPAAFKALQELVVPKLFAGRSAGATIRVWVPGCSTGEEAYSLAILLREHLEEQRKSFKLQVFATDIDSQAVAVARTGIYPASIGTDITPERLARFFTPEPGDAEGNPPAYRIRKNIRDLLIISEQNVTRDPPFSKLDLISCRNLMIYMGSELQKKLIPLFHYALNPGGFLFLGTSETVGEHADLFVGLANKAKIYQRRENFHGIQRAALGRFLPPMVGTMEEVPLRSAGRTTVPAKLPLRELTETALLQEVVPAGALVTADGDILYLHGRTGMYLEPAPGEAGVSNIIKMAREGLKHDLTVALNKAAGTLETVRLPGLRVKTNGSFRTVDLTVRPVDPRMGELARDKPAANKPSLFLVILQDVPEKPEAGDQSSAGDVQTEDRGLEDDLSGDGLDKLAVDARITALKQALRAKEEYLQAVNEELETSNEELKSSNEEMQSVNEELQSTNEELETSKEELQSVNEELVTVNSELQTKVADLSRANNDMNNLLAGTGVATVFVDHQLRILRFTPAATRLINLILSDVGRPVGHIVSNLKDYGRLSQDVQAVLDTLIPKEEQVRTAEDKWYSMRILPYRTLDNVIEGAVITFVDITESKQAQEARLEFELKYRILYELSPDAHAIAEIAENGRDLGFVDCNQAALDLLGMTRDQLLAASAVGLSPERQPDGRLSREKAGELLAQCLSEKRLRFDWLYSRLDGETVPVEVTMTVHRERGKTVLYSVWRDLTGLTRTPQPERPRESSQGEEGSHDKVQASG